MSRGNPKRPLLSLSPIGFLRTPFPDKFGIPRQPGLVPEAIGVLALEPVLREAVRGLADFSHAWVLFAFDRAAPTSGVLVRPPRLGGSAKMGVFATRSPHRPNPIGLSVFAIDSVRTTSNGGAEVLFRGVDVLDGTPVLDVKPYLPYADSVRGARAAAWAETPPRKRSVKVRFTRPALAICREMEADGRAGLRALIRALLALDPRPAHQARRGRAGRVDSGIYSMRLLDVDVHWRAEGAAFWVTAITRA